MNKQRKSATQRGIEWTDYTWNPVSGCKHDCVWEMPDASFAECYAKTVAERVAQSAYPKGFAHHYSYPSRLDEPNKVKIPSKIFLDSMSDLMGAWVSESEINQVFAACRQSPHHTFQLLTKNAPRLLKFDIPDNVWVGVSAPPTRMFGIELTDTQRTRYLARAVDVLNQLTVPVRWMSIEPLSFDIAPHLVDVNLQWMVIGAATNGRFAFQPEPIWLENVIGLTLSKSIPTFFKGNLRYPLHLWREEFPNSDGSNNAF